MTETGLRTYMASLSIVASPPQREAHLGISISIYGPAVELLCLACSRFRGETPIQATNSIGR